MKNILYMHTGSGNHGCEAIVRSTSKILNGPNDIVLWTLSKQEDELYGVTDSVDELVESEQIKKYSYAYFEALLRRKVFKTSDANKKIFIRNIFKNNVAIAIGGDNYCYEWSANQNIDLNKEIRKHCKKTVLWGCSIDEEAITEEMKTDLKAYDLITARETLTYELLQKINPNTVKVADPAFLLDTMETVLPYGFIEGNTVGINISPLIMKYGTDGNLILQNYENLIRYIINETEMNICLVPHVVWDHNNDLEPINTLYNKVKDTNRVCIVNDANCMELKWVISKCRFFVGARTHATIAAYSTCVPTLVVGYSTKARGIAIDLFGSEKNYVLPVQNLITVDDLKKHFMWLVSNEKAIVSILNKVIPEYKVQADSAKRYLNSLK